MAISVLSNEDKQNLLNINTQKQMEKIGQSKYFQYLVDSSQKTGGRVQPWEIYATISRENSDWKPNAKSSTSSATGLGQFTKATAKFMKLDDPTNPVDSIYAIGRYLNYIKNKGIEDPLAAQRAYGLGVGGYRKMMRGDKDVAGLGEQAGFVKKFNQTLAELGGDTNAYPRGAELPSVGRNNNIMPDPQITGGGLMTLVRKPKQRQTKVFNPFQVDDEIGNIEGIEDVLREPTDE